MLTSHSVPHMYPSSPHVPSQDSQRPHLTLVSSRLKSDTTVHRVSPPSTSKHPPSPSAPYQWMGSTMNSGTGPVRLSPVPCPMLCRSQANSERGLKRLGWSRRTTTHTPKVNLRFALSRFNININNHKLHHNKISEILKYHLRDE